MSLPKSYNPIESEPRLVEAWQQSGVYHFDLESNAPVYSIDTPPPTVSGNLHLGHVYSYTHTDLIARFWRMRGRNVFYPMGFDDNGLPTERLVEKRLHTTAQQVGRQVFIQKCLQVSEEAEVEYRQLWQRLGLSIDWRYTYRTIEERARRISQRSFIDLYRQGLAYRQEAPAIWCPECATTIAQAELDDLERDSEFVTLKFSLSPTASNPGEALLIATTRPELLPACVAVFIHPEDQRYAGLVGQQALVPLFGQTVPILADPAADPGKGTGAVMCCTFGDTADVAWWYAHRLPLIQAIGRDGCMTSAAGPYAGLPVADARREIKLALQDAGLMLDRQSTRQSVRVHERCDTPVEYVVARQWFIQVLPHKQALLDAGDRVIWHPEHMRLRYRMWVENLSWDWCISRQRYFGVPFPVWYCRSCGEPALADPDQLPVDPLQDRPQRPCSRCGASDFQPEEDILDTWATSSMSPQIVGHSPQGNREEGASHPDPLFDKVFPFSLRPQAHEIIRTWAFYTIAKTHFHHGGLPWKEALISGWGLAGEGSGKISKSRGGGPLPPLEMISRYSADAVRYWAASTSPGKDSIISEEKIQMGAKLVTKLWNVARFAERFISPAPSLPDSSDLTPADRWILSRIQRLIRRVTELMEACEYASAKSEIEIFFWGDLADNYLEMSKQRLYDPDAPSHAAARFTLARLLETVLKLFAPFLPFVTEAIFQGLYATEEAQTGGRDLSFAVETSRSPSGAAPFSIHKSPWPVADPGLEDDAAENLGDLLVEIATAVRRYKSEHNLSLGVELDRLQLAFTGSASLYSPERLAEAAADLRSVTRARTIEFVAGLEPGLEPVAINPALSAGLSIRR